MHGAVPKFVRVQDRAELQPLEEDQAALISRLRRPRASGSDDLPEGGGFDLADPFAGDAKGFAAFLQGAGFRPPRP